MSDEEEIFDEEHDGVEDFGPACPICKYPVSEGWCEHTVVLVGYDQVDLCVCKPGHVSKLRESVEKLSSMLKEEFTELQLALLISLLQMPSRASGVIAKELQEEYFGGYEYFAAIVTRVPGWAATEDCEGGGCGCSSSWHTTWANDAKSAGKWLDREVSKDIKALKDCLRLMRKVVPNSRRRDRDRGAG